MSLRDDKRPLEEMKGECKGAEGAAGEDIGDSWTLQCDGEGHERGDGKARPDRVAERRTALPWKRKRGGIEGEEDRMEKAEDSAEEGPDRRLGDRKGSRERSFGPGRLAKEGKK